MRHIFNIDEPVCEIPIVVQDTVTQTRKRYTVVWSDFENSIISKSMVLAGFSSQGDAMKKRIKDATDKDLLAMLNKNLSDANEYLNQLAGLDDFFKKERPEIRNKIKGIKIELTTIRNYIIKSNQRRAEYVTLAEEAEQIEMLGV